MSVIWKFRKLLCLGKITKKITKERPKSPPRAQATHGKPKCIFLK